MPPSAGIGPQPGRAPMGPKMTVHPDSFAKDSLIAWFRGEFAAANAIIDALCNHLTQLDGSPDYESVFGAIHRRRLNWVPILQMQKYYSIAEVALELRRVVDKKTFKQMNVSSHEDEEESIHSNQNNKAQVLDQQDLPTHDLPKTHITHTGSQEAQTILENVEICSNHGHCEARRARIKMTKGFIAKEPVKGHMVNVVRGLKLYEDIFTNVELSKLSEFVNELRVAGKNGELSGDTFIMYNQQLKGNKRELVQLGAPIFGQITEEALNKCQKSRIEPIPALLQGVIDHLVQWHLISENKKPNGCIINFFDEGEYSQPFQKPPHLDQPISTLLLSESSMAFGRTLVSDNDGNYRGPLMFSLKEGSLLVMRGNSVDIARHVMCQSPTKRVSITLFKVRIENNLASIPPLTRAMTFWQPYKTLNGYEEAMDGVPKWGVIRSPVVMLAPVRPIIMSPRKISRGGTGVFLPWTVGSRKPAKHLPPRAQKGRLLALPSPEERYQPDPTSDPDVSIEENFV